MSYLTEFLTARLDDEVLALPQDGGDGDDNQVAGWSASRVKEEIDFVFEIIADYNEFEKAVDENTDDLWILASQQVRETILRRFAQFYAEHPDYCDGWRL